MESEISTTNSKIDIERDQILLLLLLDFFAKNFFKIRFSLAFFLLLQLMLLCNLMIFFSFSWNKDNYSQIDEMDATDAYNVIFTTDVDQVQ